MNDKINDLELQLKEKNVLLAELEKKFKLNDFKTKKQL